MLEELKRVGFDENGIKLLKTYFVFNNTYGGSKFRLARTTIRSITGLTANNQNKADKKLEYLGFITKTLEGDPPTNHYVVHEDAIREYIERRK